MVEKMVNDDGITREYKIQMNKMSRHLLTRLTDSDISDVMNFFLIFSRFEYALKQAGFVRTDENKPVNSDWDKFSDTIASDFFTRKKEDKELETAIVCLNNKPPRKQVVGRNGTLDWEPSKPTGSEAKILSIYIRRIRNNLFHGGKFPFNQKVDKPLINHATTVLKHLLELTSASEVKRHYFQY